MPEWMHNRAEHILAKNPSMPKSEAFAIATQQSHAMGKSPKGYGTAEGKATAKAKYKTPGDDERKANPGHLESSKMSSITFHAFVDEMGKIAAEKDSGFLDAAKKVLTTPIPGTPEIFPHTAVETATRFSKGVPAAATAAAKAPVDWRAARAAGYKAA